MTGVSGGVLKVIVTGDSAAESGANLLIVKNPPTFTLMLLELAQFYSFPKVCHLCGRNLLVMPRNFSFFVWIGLLASN